VYPFIAQSLDIGIIHQRPLMADHFDVVNNIFLGNEIGRNPRMGLLRKLDEAAMYQKAAALLNRLGMDVNSLNEKVYNLTGE